MSDKIRPDSYAIVLVVWKDHHTLNQGSWTNVEQLVADSQEPLICYTVGYLLDDHEDYVLTAPTLADDNDAGEAMKIMRSLIQKITVIKKAKK